MLTQLSTELLEKIGRHTDNLSSAGILNHVLAFRDSELQTRPGKNRQIASAVPMVSRHIIVGTRSSVNNMPNAELVEPLIFSVIEKISMGQHPNAHAILEEVIRRFPTALMLPNTQGDTPLHFALDYLLREPELQLLLPKESPVLLQYLLTSKNNWNLTPLAIAVTKANMDNKEGILGLLIDVKKDVLSILSHDQFTPLQSLIYHCPEKVSVSMICLLKMNDEHDKTINDAMLLLTDDDEESALHLLMQTEDSDVISELPLCIPLLIDSRGLVLTMRNSRPVGDIGAVIVFMRQTPLHIALQAQMPRSVIELLIDADKRVLICTDGADTEGVNRNNTPLHVAIANGADSDVIELLVDTEARVMLVTNHSGNNPLQTSLSQPRHNAISAVQLFLFRKGLQHPDYLLHKRVGGQTALHIAIESSASFAVLEAIVLADRRTLFVTNKDPLINATAWHRDETPLHYALRKKSPRKIISLLFDASQELLRKKNYDHATPLHVAVSIQWPLFMIEQLIPDSLPDLRLQPWSDGQTPLHIALSANTIDPAVIKALIDGDRTVLGMRDANMQIPLHIALAHRAPVEIIHLLKNWHQTEPDTLKMVDRRGNTALNIALRHEYAHDLLLLLMDLHGTVTHTLNDHQQSPVHIAAKNNATPETMKWLMERTLAGPTPRHPDGECTLHEIDAMNTAQGALLMTVDYRGNTPLHRAIKNCAPVDILRILTDLKGNVLTIANEMGNTPMHVLILQSHNWAEFDATLAHLIDKERAVLLMSNLEKLLPLHIALKNDCHLRVIEQLLTPPRVRVPDELLYHHHNSTALDVQQTYKVEGAARVGLIQGNGFTPLHLAIMRGADLAVIELILARYGAMKYNILLARNRHGDTALQLAIRDGACVELVRLLTDVDEKVLFMHTILCDVHRDNLEIGTKMSTPLHTALQQGASLDIIRALVDCQYKVLLVKNYKNESPLHVALRANASALVVDFLLGYECGVKIEHHGRRVINSALLWQDREGNTPLHLVINSMQSEGPRIPDDDLKRYIDTKQDVLRQKNDADETPLRMFMKVKLNQVRFMSLLVDAKEDVLCAQDAAGNTPLHFALANTEAGLLTFIFLIGKTKRKIWALQNSMKHTPLCAALYARGHQICIDVLMLQIPTSANTRAVLVDMVDRKNRTPLHLALRKHACDSFVRSLLYSKKQMLLMVDNRGDTPLHCALRSPHYTRELWSILLDPHRATLTHQNADGNSPLHLAVRNTPSAMDSDMSWLESITLLMGGDKKTLFIKNHDGHTPLDVLTIMLNSTMTEHGAISNVQRETAVLLKLHMLQTASSAPTDT